METAKPMSLACTVLGIAAIPVYLSSLVVTLVLRGLVALHLSWTEPKYRGLLNVFDLFFDRDPPEARSNITVLVMIKLTQCETIEDARRKIIELAKNVMEKNHCIKLKSVIKEWNGFRYWHEANIDYNKQVRMFKASSEKELQSFLCKASNELIYDERMWEVCLGDKPIENQYPLIFKMNHAVADGIAARDMLVDSQSKPSNAVKKPLGKRIREMKSLVANVLNLAIMILFAPTLCISQYLRPADDNSLRTKKLSARKQISWASSNFQKVKEIHQKLGCSFSEVILTAVSKSLNDLFISRGERVPQITLVFPHRRSRESSGLENEFVLAPIRLPVFSERREEDVISACRALNGVPSYRLNYFAPRFACSLFPAPLPRWSFESTEFTVLVSNLPGPTDKLVFDGYEAESVCFFVPNIADNNALGITMVTYNGQYLVTCILDEAVARTPVDSERITQGIVRYIEETHANVCSL